MYRPGRIRQVAFVTRDIQRSMKIWSEVMGIGPWFFTPGAPMEVSSYRGAHCPLTLAVAMASADDMQYEFLQPMCDTPSMYRDWLARPFELELQQHVAVWSDDYEKDTAEAQAAGYAHEQGGASPNGRFTYMLHPDQPHQALEFLEMTPSRVVFFEGIARAGRNWDGRDPVRPFSAAMS